MKNEDKCVEHMRTILQSLIAAISLSACTSTQLSEPAPVGPLAGAEQLIVVTTASWDAPDARLSLYERRPASWVPVMRDVPVVVGKNGMGWGRGLPVNLPRKDEDPSKKEGDGRAPAGLFALGTTFGFHDALSGVALPYRRLTPETECVDDVRSRHYNELVERSFGTVDWTSSERMSEVPLYRIGATIQHNAPNAAPGAGSCIFFHVWRESGRGTAGCTAMEEAKLIELLRALKPEKKPILLQVPLPVYNEAKSRYELP
ncbi:L,D-transpeptidase family protein [Sorangium sp. So ce1128]